MQNAFSQNSHGLVRPSCFIVNDVIRIIKHNVFIDQLSYELDLSGLVNYAFLRSRFHSQVKILLRTKMRGTRKSTLMTPDPYHIPG